MQSFRAQKGELFVDPDESMAFAKGHRSESPRGLIAIAATAAAK